VTTLRHRLEYALLLSVKTAIRFIPFFLYRRFSKLLKALVIRFDQRHFLQVERNLVLAFPDMENSRRNGLREKIYTHFSSLFSEWIYLFVHHRRPRNALPISIKNPEHLQTLLNLNRGGILVSAHFGNWELIPYILKDLLPTPLIAIARPMNNPLVEALVQKFRRFMGSQIIYKHGALRKIITNLKDNRLIYLLIDQNAVPREAVFVDFFSQKISAIASAAQLHIKRKAPILPLFLHYEADRIVLEFQAPIIDAGADQTVASLTQQLTASIEEQIRLYPDQWFWFHNRWKTRPSGATT
jgi:KDO2-lipid IV(A) lauroyltransferase